MPPLLLPPSRARSLRASLVALLAAGCSGPAFVRGDLGRPVEASFDPHRPVFTPLERDGVPGGELRFVLPGTPEEVAAMLLDFEDAGGRRPWALRYRVLEQHPRRTVSRWDLRGKLGIAPSVVLEHRRVPEEHGLRIAFRLLETDFGLRTFEGDYRLVALTEEPPVTRIHARLFVSSGLPFVGASRKELESGLREDARRMAAWMEERSAAGAPPLPLDERGERPEAERSAPPDQPDLVTAPRRHRRISGPSRHFPASPGSTSGSTSVSTTRSRVGTNL